jgi:hypothetical protein
LTESTESDKNWGRIYLTKKGEEQEEEDGENTENTKLLNLVEEEGGDSRRWKLDTCVQGECGLLDQAVFTAAIKTWLPILSLVCE